MHAKPHLNLTREELYELVWAKPMSQIAKDYEMSDRGLTKLCTRLQVPVPPRGYWAKIFANKKTTKPTLPSFIEKPPEIKIIKQAEQVKADQKSPNDNKGKKRKRNLFEDPDKEIKRKIKEFRKTLSGVQHYTMRVTSWHSDYSLGLNINYNPLRQYDELSFIYEHPYDEYRTLLIKGDIMEPASLIGQKIEARLYPQTYLNKENIEKNLRDYREEPPGAIGSFQKQNYYIMVSISVPENAFGGLLQTALANKINFMTYYGEKMRYGRGRIYRFSLLEEYHDDED